MPKHVECGRAKAKEREKERTTQRKQRKIKKRRKKLNEAAHKKYSAK